MKIVHLADTHLGHSAYRKISENGFNQREEDIILAFLDAIDKIITLKPDIVIHSGDLFDTVRPTNRIVSIGIKQLLRLYNAKIPLVLISGNHETPKQLYKGSIYSILDELNKIKTDGLTDKELYRAKEYLKGSLVLGLESSQSRMSWIARSEFYYDKIVTVDEVFDKIDNVNSKDVSRIANEFIRDEYLSLTVIGNLKERDLPKI